MELTIRNEREADYEIVEEITRNAFYNLYVPGCVEHYLVHIMRGHEDFIPELDFVRYPAAMMVKELIPNALNGKKWFYRSSPVMNIREEDARQYDDTLKKLEKKYLPSQEEFYIMSHSYIE